MAGNAGPRYQGWRYDQSTDRLQAMFDGTEVFDFDANDLVVTPATAFTAGVTLNGTMTGARMNPIITAADTLLLTLAQSGSLVIATKASATQVFTLPAASTAAGVFYTFKCADAGGEINIDPTGTDDMQVKATNDGGANIVETDGTGIQNTAGTNVLGDYVTLACDGVGKWYTTAQSGIWATQG